MRKDNISNIRNYFGMVLPNSYFKITNRNGKIIVKGRVFYDGEEMFLIHNSKHFDGFQFDAVDAFNKKYKTKYSSSYITGWWLCGKSSYSYDFTPLLDKYVRSLKNLYLHLSISFHRDITNEEKYDLLLHSKR